MSVTEIQEKLPLPRKAFSQDPFTYRIPGNESFHDLVHRLGPFVLDMERQETSVLIFSHLTTLQVLYGYLLGKPIDEYLRLPIPAHTVIKLTPHQYGWNEERISL